MRILKLFHRVKAAWVCSKKEPTGGVIVIGLKNAAVGGAVEAIRSDAASRLRLFSSRKSGRGTWIFTLFDVELVTGLSDLLSLWVEV